jgi:ribosomal protein S10
LRIFTDELRARLGQRVPEAIAEKWSLPRGITYAAAIAKRLLDQAVDGNVRAVEEIVDRTEGKAPQPIPLTSGDVRIVVRREEPQRKNVVSTARAETQLYDQLVALVKESPNEAVMQAAANLALALKRNGKGKGNGINAATAAAPTFA